MNRRVVALLLTFIMLLSTTPLSYAVSAGGALGPVADNWIDHRAEEYSDADYGKLVIHSAEELALFAYECNNSLLNYVEVELGNDISLYGHSWVPIKAESWLKFDGNGHTISGMTIYDDIETTSDFNDYRYALFETLGSVTNLKMRNASIRLTASSVQENFSNSWISCASIACDAETVTNCAANVNIDINSEDPSLDIYAAGMVLTADTVEHCSVSGAINVHGGSYTCSVSGVVRYADSCTDSFSSAIIHVSSTAEVAGVFGYAGDAEGCVHYGNIELTAAYSKVGGVGFEVTGSAENCGNRGTITVSGTGDSSYAGGVFMNVSGDVSNCYNTGTIHMTSSWSCAGGIVCDVMESGIVSSCDFGGSVIAGQSAGGIAHKNDGDITSCRMSGKLQALYVGGIACENNFWIESCENYSDLAVHTEDEYGTTSAGGIVYQNAGTILNSRNLRAVEGDLASGIAAISSGTIEGCVNGGTVQGEKAGGIVGQLQGDPVGFSENAEDEVSVKYCENHGKCIGEGTSAVSGGIVSSIESGEKDILVGFNRNSGTVMSESGAGGVIGYIHTWDAVGDVKVQQCENNGFVSGKLAGGVIGSLLLEDTESAVTIRDVLNRGMVQGLEENNDSDAGGLIGSIPRAAFTLKNGVNTGFVSAGDDVGGVIGVRYGASYFPGLYYLKTEGLTSFGFDSGASGYMLDIVIPRNWVETGFAGEEIIFIGLSAAWAGEVLLADGIIDEANDLSAMEEWAENASEDTLYSFVKRAMTEHAVVYCWPDEIDITPYHPDTMAAPLTPAQMADAASFSGFDFENVWEMDGYPALKMIGLDGAPLVESGYYVSILDKFFRFVALDCGYPPATGFTLTLDGVPYQTGNAYDMGVRLPAGFDGEILCSKNGYHSYEMPAALVASFNTIALTPSSVQTPFVEMLLADRSSNGRKSFRNLRADGLMVYEAELGDDVSTERLYVSVNWNGHGTGEVWLQQGATKLQLIDGSFITHQLGLHFDHGETVYVCGKAEDGAEFRHATKISMTKPTRYSGIDLGSNFDVTIDSDATDSDMSFLNNQSIEFDVTEITKGLVPVKMKYAGDGTVKGTIGIGLYKEEGSLGEGQELERDSLFDMTKELVDLFKKGKGSDDGDILDKLIDRKLKELNSICEMTSVPSKFGVEGNVQLLGYFYGKYEDGDIKLTQCSMVLLFDGKVVCTVPYNAWGIAGYIKTELSAKIEAALTDWKHNEETDQLEPQGKSSLKGELSLAATYAVGYDGIVSIGAKGEGSINIETVIPVLAADTNMYLQGRIYLLGNLVGIAGEWQIFESDRQYFYYQGKLCWKKGSQVGSVSELSAEESFVPAQLALSAETAPLSEESLYTNVYPAAQTAFAVLDEYTRILVWQGARETDIANGGALYYSVGDGYDWSEPHLLDMDGTADFNPVLKNVNGTVYLIWNDVSESYDALPEDLSSSVRASQISVARFDPETNRFVDLGTTGVPEKMDLAADLREMDGSVQLCWQSYQPGVSEPVLMSAMLGDTGWVMQTEESVPWYAPDTTPEDMPVRGETADYVLRQGNGCLVYAEGGKIYGVFHENGLWGSAMELAELPAGTEAYSLSADCDPYGKLLVAVSCGSLTMTDGVLSGQSDVLFFELEPDADIVVSEAGYISDTLFIGEYNDLVVWADVENKSAEMLHLLKVSISNENGVVDSYEIPVEIPSGVQETVHFSLALPDTADAVSDSYTFRFSTDAFAEQDVTNNTAVCAIRKADLSVEGLHAIAYEDAGKVTAWVVNRGLTDVADAVVQLVSAADGASVLAVSEPFSLERGAGKVIRFADVDLSGETQLIARIPELESENITANNSDIATIQIYRPGKLSVSLSGATRDGEKILAAVEIANETTTDASVSLLVACYDSGGKMTDSVFYSSVAIAAGGTWTETAALDGVSDVSMTVKVFALSADGKLTPLQQAVSGAVA